MLSSVLYKAAKIKAPKITHLAASRGFAVKYKAGEAKSVTSAVRCMCASAVYFLILPACTRNGIIKQLCVVG
jgi:hypothetical protein